MSWDHASDALEHLADAQRRQYDPVELDGLRRRFLVAQQMKRFVVLSGPAKVEPLTADDLRHAREDEWLAEQYELATMRFDLPSDSPPMETEGIGSDPLLLLLVSFAAWALIVVIVWVLA